MHPQLSFEQAPPISVPYRFFLSAPWFSAAAGLLLLFYGESVLATRWSPQTLALTHLLTAGFMLQAMCGALLQFVPVAAGANVTRPKLVAAIVHPLLVAGAVLLVAGFLWGNRTLLLAAIGPLTLGCIVLVGVIGRALWKVPVASPVLVALRIAVVSLFVTVALGAFMAWTLGRNVTAPLLELTESHVIWGLGAWALSLLVGVSLYVVPMFQLTPPYPARYARIAPPALMALAGFGLIQIALRTGAWQTVAGAGTLIFASAYAGITLRLQSKRRRRVTDPAFWFFRGAMVCALSAAGLYLAAQLATDLRSDVRYPITLGVLLIGGGFVSAINGMMYKIAPFINWLHLQRIAGVATMPPTMREMIGERAMQAQMGLHFAALATLLGAVWLPLLTRPAGFLWALSAVWLGSNLLGAARRYVGFRDRIRAAASCHAPESSSLAP